MKKDGGSAFPSSVVVTDAGISYEGMSLRDYFASSAMQGLLASPTDPWNTEGPITNKQIAKLAYHIADAMLKERDE
jgi:hypothetical protein